MPLRPRNHFIILALLIVLGSGAVSPLFSVRSQERQAKDQKSEEPKGQSAPVVRLETELVQIDVVITDKEGKIVRNLKREDFQLLEEGKPQTISYFSVGTAANPAAAPKVEPKTKDNQSAAEPKAGEISAGRYLVLAIDDLHLAAGNLMQAKQALLRFIDRQVGIDDQVALITTSGQLGLFQQFTSEKEALRRGVNRLSVQERITTSNVDVPRITPYQAELIEMGDRDALEIAVQELMRRLQMDRRMATAEASSKARMIIQENVSVTVSTLSTLENVTRSLKPLPGRKVIVLLSDGFLLGGFREGRHFDVRRITDAATKAGVVIYSIDARGLVAMPSTMDASQPNTDPIEMMGVRSRIESSSIDAQRDGLNALARDTGGIPIFNNNDINLGLQRVLDDTETYYLLAFEPNTSYRDGRFRQLEVRIPGRSDLKVRTRKGYFAPDQKAAEKEARTKEKQAEKDKEKSPEKLAKEAQAAKQAQVREGIGSLFPLRGIPVQMSTSFIDTPQDGSVVEIAANIDAAALKFDQVNDRHRATLDVVMIVFDENGKSVENVSDSVQLNLKTSSLENARKNGVNYSKLFKLKPGFYQVRMMAREEGITQIGSASSWIEIPDLSKKQLALSSIFFVGDGNESNPLLPTQSTPNSGGERAHSMFQAKISRRFKRDSGFDFMIFAYNAGKDAKGATDLVVQTQIYIGGKVLLATPLKNFSDPNSNSVKKDGDQPGFPYLARLSLESFSPGTYELRLVVIDRNAKTSAKRSVNFTVE